MFYSHRAQTTIFLIKRKRRNVKCLSVCIMDSKEEEGKRRR